MSGTDDPIEQLQENTPKVKKHRMTPMKMAFVYHLARTGRVRKAAEMAGYSPNTAEVRGSNLLAEQIVQDALAEEIRRVCKAEGVSEEAVIARAASWAEANMADYFHGDWNALKAPEELTEEQQKRIKKVKVTQGEYGATIDLELHDAMKANTELAKYLGMLDKHDESDMPSLEKMAEDLRHTLSAMDEVEGVETIDAAAGRSGEAAPTTH